jgi:transcriptional regulator with XRE-family HTH domain
MIDMNIVIAENILNMLKFQNKTRSELAGSIGVDKATIDNMLSGSRIISAIELQNIANFFSISIIELTRFPKIPIKSDVLDIFEGRVKSEQSRDALKTADILSDMILFHKKVRENGTSMAEAWDS